MPEHRTFERFAAAVAGSLATTTSARRLGVKGTEGVRWMSPRTVVLFVLYLTLIVGVLRAAAQDAEGLSGSTLAGVVRAHWRSSSSSPSPCSASAAGPPGGAARDAGAAPLLSTSSVTGCAQPLASQLNIGRSFSPIFSMGWLAPSSTKRL